MQMKRPVSEGYSKLEHIKVTHLFGCSSIRGCPISWIHTRLLIYHFSLLSLNIIVYPLTAPVAILI